jgi:hypothetical protein
MKNPITSTTALCVAISSTMFCCANSFAQQKYELSRRGGVREFRAIERPALVDALAETSEPVVLNPDEFAQLKAYLVAVSRPRRMEKDEYYRTGRKTQGAAANQGDVSSLALADPIHVSMMFPRIDRVRDWQRLRMHFVYNEELLASRRKRSRNATTDEAEAAELRKTVAVQVGRDVRWFAVDSCRRSWTSTSSQGGALFLTATGRFVLLTPDAEWTGAPAKFVDDGGAVIWLAINGHEMPEELTQAAASLRLTVKDDHSAP